jgi:hypothetical protein
VSLSHNPFAAAIRELAAGPCRCELDRLCVSCEAKNTLEPNEPPIPPPRKRRIVSVADIKRGVDGSEETEDKG